MKSRPLLKSKSSSNKHTIQSQTRLRKPSSHFTISHPPPPPPHLPHHQRSLNETQRQQRAALMSRIDYLDHQYKKLSNTYKSNKYVVGLVEENERLNSKVRRLREERNEQKGRVKELEEEVRRGKEERERERKKEEELMRRLLEMEGKYVKEREMRMELEREGGGWKGAKENVQQNYYKVIDLIEKLKTEIVE